MGYRIHQGVKAVNAQQMDLLLDTDTQAKDNDHMAISAKQEVRFRKRSERNMWIVILTIFVVDTYMMLYSMILAWGTDNCLLTDSPTVHSFSNIFERSLQYVWWLFPVIWLFWPNDARCECLRRKRSRTHSRLPLTSSASTKTMSINSQMMHDDSYSDDDKDEDQGYPEQQVQTFLKKSNFDNVAPNPMPFIVNNGA